MKSAPLFLRLMPLAAVCTLLSGCLFKPTTVQTRSFVLASIPQPAVASPAAGHLPVGVGLVKMPSYLLRSSLAMRIGTNEIHYLENALWAEQLNQSFQRAIAANLSLLLPSDQIRLSAWQRQDITVALYVNVEQFDVDAQGRGTLIAWWRVAAPDGDKILKSGQSRLIRNGPPAGTQPETIVATLSELTAEFSRILATAIQDSAPGRATVSQ